MRVGEGEKKRTWMGNLSSLFLNKMRTQAEGKGQKQKAHKLQLNSLKIDSRGSPS